MPASIPVMLRFLCNPLLYAAHSNAQVLQPVLLQSTWYALNYKILNREFFSQSRTYLDFTARTVHAGSPRPPPKPIEEISHDARHTSGASITPNFSDGSSGEADAAKSRYGGYQYLGPSGGARCEHRRASQSFRMRRSSRRWRGGFDVCVCWTRLTMVSLRRWANISSLSSC